jgi:hypothetical protein
MLDVLKGERFSTLTAEGLSKRSRKTVLGGRSALSKYKYFYSDVLALSIFVSYYLPEVYYVTKCQHLSNVRIFQSLIITAPLGKISLWQAGSARVVILISSVCDIFLWI